MAYFRSDGWIRSVAGSSVSGAQVYVCSQPADESTLPPTPLADIFSDPNGVVPILQPVLTDGFGHYDFYVLPGFYTIVVAHGGEIQQIYPDQPIGVAGGAVSTLVLQVNGVANLNQNLLNFKNTATITVVDNGDGSLSFTNVAPGLLLKTNGVNNGSQSVLNLKSGSNISLVDDGVGGVSVTNLAPSFSTGTFSFASVHGFSASTDVFGDIGTPRLGMNYNGGNTSHATVVGPTATEGAAYQIIAPPNLYNQFAEDFLAGTSTGSHTAIYSSTFGSLQVFETKVKVINPLDATVLIWFGMGDNIEFNPYFTDDPVTSYCTLFEASGLTQTWRVYISNGSVSQQVDTGIPLDTNYHVLKIVHDTTFRYYIDGVLVATFSFNLPPDTGSPAWMMLVYNPFSVSPPDQGANVLYAWWQTA